MTTVSLVYRASTSYNNGISCSEANFMATKSIFKNIVIKDRSLSRKLVLALENAKGKSSKHVVLSKSYHEAKKGQIKDIFGEPEVK